MKKTLFEIVALFVSATLFAQNNSIKVNGLEISYCYVTIFIDTATQKIKLISATTTSDFM